MASSEPSVEALGARGQGESECIFLGTMENVRSHCCSKDGIITSPPAVRGDDTMTSLVQGTMYGPPLGGGAAGVGWRSDRRRRRPRVEGGRAAELDHVPLRWAEPASIGLALAR